MRVSEISLGRSVYLLWGVLDICAIVLYVYSQWRAGKLPLMDDATLFMDALFAYQGVDGYFFLIANLILMLSIPISAVLLIKYHHRAKTICLFQAPLRVLLYYPSIFFVVKVAALVSFSVVWWLVFLFVLELAKLYTLFKYGPVGSHGRAPDVALSK